MPAIDFITALGRLLHDGALRDAFASDSAALMHQLELREPDRALFLQLVPADLEFQARVLMRKRFDLVRRALPRTCAALGEDAWLEFVNFARPRVSTPESSIARDAIGFGEHVRRIRAGCICEVECARAAFAGGRRRFAIRVATVFGARKRRVPCLQIFFRPRAAKWHEWMFYFRV
jgi:hypothetical protein